MAKLPYWFADRWLAAKRFHIFLVIAIRIYFSVNVMNEIYSSMELAWKYGILSSILFLKSSIPFHLASSIFHTEISVPFHLPFHILPCSLIASWAPSFHVLVVRWLPWLQCLFKLLYVTQRYFCVASLADWTRYSLKQQLHYAAIVCE